MIFLECLLLLTVKTLLSLSFHQRAWRHWNNPPPPGSRCLTLQSIHFCTHSEHANHWNTGWSSPTLGHLCLRHRSRRHVTEKNGKEEVEFYWVCCTAVTHTCNAGSETSESAAACDSATSVPSWAECSKAWWWSQEQVRGSSFHSQYAEKGNYYQK